MSKKRRKRPGRHTVRPKHSRYNVPSYPRGEGPLANRGVSHPRNVSNNVVSDIRQLSSGTISTLTGSKKYSDIDRERDSFARWTEAMIEKGRQYDTWQDAWSHYHDARNSKSTIIYANSEDEARSKVEERFGRVREVEPMGVNHMGNPYFRVTFVKGSKKAKIKNETYLGETITFTRKDGRIWAKAPEVSRQFLGSGRTKSAAFEELKRNLSDIKDHQKHLQSIEDKAQHPHDELMETMPDERDYFDEPEQREDYAEAQARRREEEGSYRHRYPDEY